MTGWQTRITTIYAVTIILIWCAGLSVNVHAMPAQVMIIRHAEKYEDRQKIHLNNWGLTRAKALSQFFQTDPRVLEHGIPATIIAQKPSPKKKSVRCEETVEPLAQALGQKIIDHFAYGEVFELVEWLRSNSDLDSKSVLICAQHLDIQPIARALGVPNIGQAVWPHETYDRVWLIDFSLDGKVSSFRDIPQLLLFGDSFHEVLSPDQSGKFGFSQTFQKVSDGPTGTVTAAKWQCRITAEAPGDFSQFDENTVPILRLGGFTFGYFATTLGKLRQSKSAEVKTDISAGSGSLRYNYKAMVDGVEQTYAWVTFSWNKEGLKAEFQAEVDANRIIPELNMPIDFNLSKSEGMISGVASCYLAMGKKRFYAPAGLTYSGIVSKIGDDQSNKEIYNTLIREENGVIVQKRYLPEL
ncbi:MAG: histidine phosphatase family protein [Pseudomonadota bacterium]